MPKLVVGMIAGITLFTGICAAAQTPFAPLEAWKAAVVNADQRALAKLYSAKPEHLEVGNAPIAIKDEWAFWAGLKRKGLTSFNPRVLEVATEKGNTRLVLRISATLGDSHLYAGMVQEWARQPDSGWKLVASKRGDFAAEPARSLPQPVVPNVSLYSDPREAEAELKAGLARAARERKRVIVVFGGNWCYDCHVLDTTFHSKTFAPLVDANYVVIHINIGDGGKDNHELAAHLGVVLDKGVPSLGVLEPDGKVVYAQKNGEFESTVKIGADDVRAFLERWKPRRG
jgi:ketosteroid isomerase-like protein